MSKQSGTTSSMSRPCVAVRMVCQLGMEDDAELQAFWGRFEDRTPQQQQQQQQQQQHVRNTQPPERTSLDSPII